MTLPLVAELPSVIDLLSSDISQKSRGDQRTCKSVIRSHTRRGRGSGLVAYHFPKLDSRLQRFHIYTGHLSELESGLDGEIR